MPNCFSSVVFQDSSRAEPSVLICNMNQFQVLKSQDTVRLNTISLDGNETRKSLVEMSSYDICRTCG